MSQTKYYYTQRAHQLQLIQAGFFRGDAGGGFFDRSRKYPYVLKDGKNNLFPPIINEAISYFNDNNFHWWGELQETPFVPTGHVLSSQVACINHLMPIRKDRETVLSVINNLGLPVKFTDVALIESDEVNPGYIGFEVVSDTDYLNEMKNGIRPTRGHCCTSVDACILAVDENNERWLLPIEWKYTEDYCDSLKNDKSTEAGRGAVRQNRYNHLIRSSRQLKKPTELQSSIYYFEPFYQLMRQTLWAEQMIEHKAQERIKADHFVHIHVIPLANRHLMYKKYRHHGAGLEDSWKAQLTDPSKYILVDPMRFIAPIESKYPDLIKYLRERYSHMSRID